MVFTNDVYHIIIEIEACMGAKATTKGLIGLKATSIVDKSDLARLAFFKCMVIIGSLLLSDALVHQKITNASVCFA